MAGTGNYEPVVIPQGMVSTKTQKRESIEPTCKQSGWELKVCVVLSYLKYGKKWFHSPNLATTPRLSTIIWNWKNFPETQSFISDSPQSKKATKQRDSENIYIFFFKKKGQEKLQLLSSTPIWLSRVRMQSRNTTFLIEGKATQHGRTTSSKNRDLSNNAKTVEAKVMKTATSQCLAQKPKVLSKTARHLHNPQPSPE